MSSASAWPKEYTYHLLTLYFVQIRTYTPGYSLQTDILTGNRQTSNNNAHKHLIWGHKAKDVSIFLLNC